VLGELFGQVDGDISDTLETIAQVSDDPIISMPAVAN